MRKWTRQFIVCVALVTGLPNAALALPGDPSSSSPNFSVVEGEIGGNGQFISTSSNFNINPNIDDGGSSLGETAVGNSASTNFQTNSGFNTTAQPALTFVVNTASLNLGALSTSAKSTGIATFNVKNYTSYGYAVQIVGTTPTYGGHPLTALVTDTASVAGTEQFGVNAVLNSTSGVGANAVQVPGATFSYGVAGDGTTGTYGTNRPYTVAEKWRYVSGETVASAPVSTGETDYTLTFMANISALTPGGAYTGNLSLVATGTY